MKQREDLVNALCHLVDCLRLRRMFTVNHECDAGVGNPGGHVLRGAELSMSCEQMDNGCKHVTVKLCDTHGLDALHIQYKAFEDVPVVRFAGLVNAARCCRKRSIISYSCNETKQGDC